MHVSSKCLFYGHIGFLFFLHDAMDMFSVLYFFQVFILWRFSVHIGFLFFSVMHVSSKCLFYGHIGFLFFMLCMFLPSVFSMGISVFCSLCDACFFQVFFLWAYRFSVLYVMHVSSKCLFYRHIGFLFFL